MSTGSRLGRPPLGPWLLYMGWMMGVNAIQSMCFSVSASLSWCLAVLLYIFLRRYESKESIC